MEPDPQTRQLLGKIAASSVPPVHLSTAAQVREVLRKSAAVLGPPRREVHHTADVVVPGPSGGFRVRLYWPRKPAAGRPLPLLLHYHGGGFVAGDLDTHDGIARTYCTAADALVVSVDYRLAPEHRFPAAVEDAFAALCWAAANARGWGGDPERIAVTGDSAGGNLAAVVSQLAVTGGGPAVVHQALVCPVVEMDPAAEYPSRRTFGTGAHFLSREDLRWFSERYLADLPRQAADARASPVRVPDPGGLPPALVVTAGFDPLRDEGRHYADRLAAAGVPTEHRCFESTIHGFTSFAGVLDAGERGLELVADRLRKALHGKAA